MRSEIEAPRWRRALAGIADVAIAGAAAWLWRGRVEVAAGAGRARWAPLLAPATELLRQQLGSPGQHLLGVRTVDRRTGRRVELWRALVLLGAAVGGQLLARRLAPAAPTPEQERERERFGHELRAVYERHPAESSQRQAELSELSERHPGAVTVNLWRAVAPSLAAGVINSRLRRRLAPTTEVLARRRGDHSP